MSHPSSPNKADAHAFAYGGLYAQAAGRNGDASIHNPYPSGEAQEPITESFRRAMNEFDEAFRRHSREQESAPLSLWALASSLGLAMMDHFRAVQQGASCFRQEVKNLSEELQDARLRADYRDAREAALELLYIRSQRTSQDIANQASRLNDQKNELSRHCRTLEKLNANQALKIAENDSLKAMLRDLEAQNAELSNARRIAEAEIDDMKEQHGSRAQALASVRKVSRQRYNTLNLIVQHIEGIKGDGSAAMGFELGNIRKAALEGMGTPTLSNDEAPEKFNGKFGPLGWYPDMKLTHPDIVKRLAELFDDAWFRFSENEGEDLEAFYRDMWKGYPAALEEILRHLKGWRANRDARDQKPADADYAPEEARNEHSWRWDADAGEHRCVECGKLVSEANPGYCAPEEASRDGINRQAQLVSVAEAVAAAE